MKQKVTCVQGKTFLSCQNNVKEITEDMNVRGFELTTIAVQCMNNDSMAYTEAMLVFTKK